MKKFFYLLPVVALLFAACSDDDNGGNGPGPEGGKITVKSNDITNAPAEGSIDRVLLIVEGGTSTTLATASWNNGFEIEFPETVSSSLLVALDDLFYLEGSGSESVEVSDRSAKVCHVAIEGWKGTSYVDDFFLFKSVGDKEYYGEYYYSDKEVTIKGVVSDGNWKSSFDLKFNKGWNTVVFSEDGDTEVYSSTIPSGMAWKFGFDDTDEGNDGNEGDGNGGIDDHILSLTAGDIDGAPDNGQVDEVRLIAYGPGDGKLYDLAVAAWNNGFTLELPENVTSSCLETVYDTFISGDFEDDYRQGNIHVSDEQANLFYAYLYGYKNGESVGTFELDNNSDDGTFGERWVEYIYCDRNVDITGEWTDEDGDHFVFDLRFITGWNVFYGDYRSDNSVASIVYRSEIPDDSDIWWQYRPSYSME